MGYRLKRLDEPIFMAGPKPMQTDFGIHQRLESCGDVDFLSFLDPELPEKPGIRSTFWIYKIF